MYFTRIEWNAVIILKSSLFQCFNNLYGNQQMGAACDITSSATEVFGRSGFGYLFHSRHAFPSCPQNTNNRHIVGEEGSHCSNGFVQNNARKRKHIQINSRKKNWLLTLRLDCWSIYKLLSQITGGSRSWCFFARLQIYICSPNSEGKYKNSACEKQQASIVMGGCIGTPRDGSSPNGDSSDGTGVGHSGTTFLHTCGL